ncbi:MAG: hypothetical protein AcusKO_28120 [Acuticoccus sp.]
MTFAPAARPILKRAMAATLAVTLLVPPALAETGPRLPLLAGVAARAGAADPVPPARPTIADGIARECEVPDPELEWARLPRTLREVPLRAMIGQLLVVSYSGKAPGARGVEIARQALRRSEIGGVLTFRYNIASADAIRTINETFESAHPVLPALIAIDQEGGAVSRLRPAEGVPETPSAEDIAAAGLPAAEDAYEAMAEGLAELGFTINFGPVVDLAVNPKNPVIARFGRSFGATPDKVVRFAEAFIDAHRDNGVATSLKHFPGHGSSTADSHEGAIDLSDTWNRRELTPFASLIARNLADTVMIGHLELDGVTGPGALPASLSPVTITRLLRNTLCFGGLVISDDLAMDAIEHHWGTPEATRLMIEAGGDIALISLPSGKGMALVTEVTDYLVAAADASPELADKIRLAYASRRRLQAAPVSDAPPPARPPPAPTRTTPPGGIWDGAPSTSAREWSAGRRVRQGAGGRTGPHRRAARRTGRAAPRRSRARRHARRGRRSAAGPSPRRARHGRAPPAPGCGRARKRPVARRARSPFPRAAREPPPRAQSLARIDAAAGKSANPTHRCGAPAERGLRCP